MLLKTPFRLIHFPGVALAIAGAALVLAAVTVSTRLFLPAAGDAALQQELGQIGGVPALSVVMFSPIGPNELAALSRQVEGVVGGRVPRLLLVATHSQEFLAQVDRVLTIRDGELAGD